ncbi:hypothetical protein ABVK25_001394 [Lepraria finkii]|uniref:Uncharacterized protein n=1 Tax=Lepraria finkii TaxID=1340010 RepID=A0ABR4BLK4_9LECA
MSDITILETCTQKTPQIYLPHDNKNNGIRQPSRRVKRRPQSIPGDNSKKYDVKRLANEGASKKPKAIHLLVNSAEIARDDNIRFSKAGKPDFSSAQAISKHFMQSELEK